MSNTGQGALAILQTDILTAAAGPILQFLQTIKPANGQPPSAVVIAGAWVQLNGALLAGLPALEGQIVAQIIVALQTKLNDAMSKLTPPAPAPTVTG